MLTPDLIQPPLGYLLKQAQHALQRQMEEALKPLGLTPAQYAVLVALRSTPDQTNADLAEAAFLTPQSMQGVLAKLETAGLVQRRPDQNHGRRQLARVTSAGLDLATKADKTVNGIEARLADAAAPLPVDQVYAALLRLRLSMQA